eukprot:4549248-Amphidinium_carterae.2
MAARSAWEASQIFSDYQYIVSMAAAGPLRAQQPQQLHAHLWKDFWDGQQLEVCKICAHQNLAQALSVGFIHNR